LNIQLINYNGSNDYKFEVSKISKLSNPISFDEYDLNIIDLRSEYIWRNKNPSTRTQAINVIEDFKSLKSLINRTKKSFILLILPENLNFKTNFTDYDNKYKKSTSLKDLNFKFKLATYHKLL